MDGRMDGLLVKIVVGCLVFFSFHPIPLCVNLIIIVTAVLVASLLNKQIVIMCSFL